MCFLKFAPNGIWQAILKRKKGYQYYGKTDTHIHTQEQAFTVSEIEKAESLWLSLVDIADILSITQSLLTNIDVK